MNKRIITIILALAAVCGGAKAQWKQGEVPPSSRRGSTPPTEIDTAEASNTFFHGDTLNEWAVIPMGGMTAAV